MSQQTCNIAVTVFSILSDWEIDAHGLNKTILYNSVHWSVASPCHWRIFLHKINSKQNATLNWDPSEYLKSLLAGNQCKFLTRDLRSLTQLIIRIQAGTL